MQINKATKTVVMAFGILLAFAGIEHGIGEILQGNVEPDSIFIKSWGDSELFSIFAGEPAMSLIPNFFISGILAILVSIGIIIWVIFFLNTRMSGLILVLLSGLLLIVGGGFGPPLIGFIIGFAGMKINSDFPMLRTLRTTGMVKFISHIWKFSTPFGIFCYLFLIPGSVILWGAFGFYSPVLLTVAIVLAFLMIFVSIISAYFYDAIRQSENSI